MIFSRIATYHICHTPRLPAYDAAAYQYLLAGNGVFVRTEIPFFSAILPIGAAEVRGLPPLNADFRLKVPRLPEKLLAAALSDAKRARNRDGTLRETLYHFHHYGARCVLRRPRQQGDATSVTAAGSDAPSLLCELHTHGALPAFWSAVDEADELGARLYAVVGRLDQPQSEIRLRVGVYGYWHPLPVTALFTGAAGMRDLHSAETTLPVLE